MSSEMVHYEVFYGERPEKPGKNNDSASIIWYRKLFGVLLSHPMVTSLDALRVLPAGESRLSKELPDIKTLGDLGGFSRSD